MVQKFTPRYRRQTLIKTPKGFIPHISYSMKLLWHKMVILTMHHLALSLSIVKSVTCRYLILILLQYLYFCNVNLFHKGSLSQVMNAAGYLHLVSLRESFIKVHFRPIFTHLFKQESCSSSDTLQFTATQFCLVIQKDILAG